MPESAPLTREPPPRAATSRDKPREITVQSLLGLNRNEIEILMRLVAWGQLARAQVPAIATRGHRSVSINSVNAIMRGLRQKLAAHDIRLGTIREFGWKLPQEDREKIVAMIKPRQGLGIHTEAMDAKTSSRVAG